MTREVQLYVGEALGRYGFPNGHPFGPDRQDAFWKEADKQGLPARVALREPREASREEIEAIIKEDPFHEHGLAEFRVIEFRASQRADDIQERIERS